MLFVLGVGKADALGVCPREAVDNVCYNGIGIASRLDIGQEARLLFKVGCIAGSDSGVTGTGDVRNRDSRDDGDNCDDNEKFDQAERRVELCFE